MRKRLIYIAVFALLLVSCEEYYNPKMDVVPDILVVESHLTNDPNQNFVKLTKTLDFYNKGSQEAAVNAEVYLVHYKIKSIRGTESSAGYFTFPETPQIGEKYLLRITYQYNIYESEVVIMPPLPTIDTLYTNHKVLKSYRTDAFGGPTQVETLGREICIDAPIKPALEYYRFKWQATIQWRYQSPSTFGPPPPPYYGWISYYQTGSFNIAGPKQFSVSEQIKNHPVLFLGYDSRAYLDSSAQIPQGWIVIIDQYGTTKKSYDFHEQLNKQFTAEGSLFDPVLTQVYGNITCKTDPTKLVLGFFDLNSYRQYRYFMSLGSSEDSQVIQRRISRHLDIPGRGFVRGYPPEFWEYY
jgi:hypothetical protein